MRSRLLLLLACIMLLSPLIGCKDIASNIKAKIGKSTQGSSASSSSGLIAPECRYLTFTIITMANRTTGLSYNWGKNKIPVTWDGRAFSAEFSGKSGRPGSSDRTANINISGTISADGKTVEVLVFKGNLIFPTATIEQDVTIKGLPYFSSKRDLPTRLFVKYMAKGTDCNSYISSWNCQSVGKNGSQPVQAGFPNNNHYIEAQFHDTEVVSLD